jgi:hypothetical protein
MHISKFIAEKYYCNLGAAMNLFCVDKMKRVSKVVEVEKEKLEEEKQANAGQQQAIKYLKSVMEHNNFEEILKSN